MPRSFAPPALAPGAVLTASARYRRAEIRLPDSHEDGSAAALHVRGDNLTIDFGGTTLRGTAPDTEPDARRGTALHVTGRNITLKNLKIHGYKIGIVARDCPGLTLENIDASHNWKQRLASTPEREDLADWMSFHQNEKDEWLRYGAAFYLVGCDSFTVRRCRAVGGQCGLMLTSCDRGLVAENDFSFLSAIGLGMYRSSRNRILHNRIDWCVRGYSHGVYNRGQDSAGILIYEQSHHNVFAYNSVTHGGDGFFLWAGQTTMDTGRGGCDDNLLYANDFSHAPTNGIEATFSRNQFVHNLILECWHGVWGGYSYDTDIVANVFGLNAEGIAIEHGRDNRIVANRFVRDRLAINLWKNPTQDPNWAYVRKHDTTSRDYRIAANRFQDCGRTLAVRATDRVVEQDNATVQSKPAPPEVMAGSGLTVLATEADAGAYRRRFEVGWKPLEPPAAARPFHVDPLPGARSAFLKRGALRGRRYIFVDEWGPYDFQRPLLWPRGDGLYEVLGPKGRWRLVSADGARVSAKEGAVPGEVRIDAPKGQAGNTKVVLEYVGAETVDHRGNATPAGKPVRFGFSRFFAPIDWNIRFHRWSKPEDPSDVHSAPDPQHVREVLSGAPVAQTKADRLDFAGGFGPGVPGDHFLTVAEGTFTIPPGEYVLEVTTDDGCRVWLDGKPILSDAWKYQGPTLYPVPVRLGGKHTLRVEHFQIDGYAALKVRLRPKG